MTDATSCSMYEGCSAPICPMDKQSLELAIWMPDEPICGKRGLKVKWLRIQKRIARKAKDTSRYFSLADFQVKRVQNPKGHNPQKEVG